MRELQPLAALVNRPFRTQAQADALIGTYITIRSQTYRVTHYNDLGCLYGVKVNGNHTGTVEYVLD